jgi:ectoine hydroxylase-related dioxygenase (phytanoyl-CoA dioxygenase family)
MVCDSESLDRDGFLLLREAVPSELVERVRLAVAQREADSRSGNRRSPLEWAPEVRQLFCVESIRRLVESTIGPSAFVVRSLLFDKVPGANWNVPWHQDQIIAVEERRDVTGFGAWSQKQGVVHVRPPAEVLAGVLTLRLHLDPCPVGNGPLKLLAGSHRHGFLTSDQIVEWGRCQEPVVATAAPGDLLAMRPLLLHASDRAHEAGHRRVLHFDLAVEPLPGGLEWRRELVLADAKPEKMA